MNIFQLIKKVLDDSYADIEGDDVVKDRKVAKCLELLSAAYSNLANKANPNDYGDPAARLAYVFSYVTSHTCLVADAIEHCKPLEDLCQCGAFTISCLGGGPGSDFLGILRYMMDNKCKGTLQCHLLDRQPGWGDAWADVGTQLVGMPFTVHTHFQQLDATEIATWTAQKKYLSADLFTMVYFASELFAIKDKAQPFFEHTFDRAKSGSKLLYIDNFDARFTGWIESVAKTKGFKPIKGWEEDARLPHAEQKTDLEPYMSKFKRTPKLTAKVAVRIMQKT